MFEIADSDLVVTGEVVTTWTKLNEPNLKHGKYECSIVVPEAEVRELAGYMENLRLGYREEYETFQDEEKWPNRRLFWEARDKHRNVIPGMVQVNFSTKYKPRLRNPDGTEFTGRLTPGSKVRIIAEMAPYHTGSPSGPGIGVALRPLSVLVVETPAAKLDEDALFGLDTEKERCEESDIQWD